ncbi:MAG: hypothetical protein SFX19_01620 [Alphaproteobacteria bacterium]|nr:hypothetical protein [Alphaproteobacteria bacterium]
MKTIFATIFAFCSIVSYAWADDAQVKKYKDYTPEQLRDLSNEEREKSVPMMYSMAAQRGLSVDSKLAFAMDLNTLMYPGVGNYDAAVKAFQSDMGEKPTGTLTVWQIWKLQERADMQKLGNVAFPDSFSSVITNDSARIEGTAIIIDEKIAWPINHVTVNCYKADKYCEVAQIVLVLPDEQSWAQQYQVMDTGKDFYKITRWENDNIDAVSMNTCEACRTVSLNYNFKTKEFIEITRNTDKDCKILDKAMPKLPKPRMSQIVDGKKIIQQEFGNLRKKAYGYLASDFRKQVDELEKKYPPKPQPEEKSKP